MGKLYPLDENQATLINTLDSSLYSKSLPIRPYCTDNLVQGIYPRLQRIAITKNYIQLNPPSMQHWLVFDIDRPNSAYAWDDVHLPPPFAVVVNKQNSHCHIIYALETPVCTSDYAHLRPLRYLAAIQQAMTEKLQADFNYSGLIAKNPFSDHWHVFTVVIQARYSLDELADYLDLTQTNKRAQIASEVASLGRNCFIFGKLRQISYKSIRKYRAGNVTEWRAHVLDKAIELNVFSTPLQYNEVKAIAKSVANWVWKHMRQDSEKFIEKQRRRGKASGQSRRSKANNHKVAAQALKDDGMTLADIARTLGIARTKVINWKLE